MTAPAALRAPLPVARAAADQALAVPPDHVAEGRYLYALLPAAACGGGLPGAALPGGGDETAPPGLPPPGVEVTALPVGADPAGAPLRLDIEGCGPFALLTSAAPADLTRTRRNMLAHAKVVEAAMRVTPLLPVRFGMVADDWPALGQTLTAREGEIAALFARLSGRIEVGLRVSWEREAALAALAAARPDLAAARSALPARGEAAYQARIALGRAVAEALDAARGRQGRALLARLLPLAEDHVLKAPQEDVEILRADFLMPAGAEPAFAAAVEAALAEPGPPCRLRYVAPAPVWNFCTLSLDLGPRARPAAGRR